MQRADRVGDHATHLVILGINHQLGLDMLDVEESDSFASAGAFPPWQTAGALAEPPVLALWPRTSGLESARRRDQHQIDGIRINLDMIFPDQVSRAIDAFRSLFYSRSGARSIRPRESNQSAPVPGRRTRADTALTSKASNAAEDRPS